MIGFRQAFNGNSTSARTASPTAGMYTLVNDNIAKIQTVIETRKLVRTSKPNLTHADVEVFRPRNLSRKDSLIIIALHAQPVQMK